jgi:2'-5' RNA ligase
VTERESAGRFFLAVPLAEPVRSALAAELRERGPLPGRPVPPENWHLTLRFLGDTPEPALRRLREEVASAPLGERFSVRFGEYGAFPRASRATVLWLGLAGDTEPLDRLAQAVEQAVRSAGFPAERRPFKPHLTLSRIRAPEDARGVLDRLPPFPRLMPVEEVVLFRSHLGGGPPRYEAAERFPLD